MCDRLTNQIEQYNVAFNRPTCAFFDPAVKNGGPNPDECKYTKNINVFFQKYRKFFSAKQNDFFINLFITVDLARNMRLRHSKYRGTPTI